jgi:chemotaxis protein MotB
LEEAERIRLEAETARLEEEALRLEAEAADLARFKSTFFGELRDILEGQDRIRIDGDRFIFNSEVLFAPGSADLSEAGKAEIANIADILRVIAEEIPDGIDWFIRVDGHTDNVPIRPGGRFADNWELSQARALSVVRFMSEDLGIDPRRLAANGFGEFQPINPLNTPEARAQNRRIEMKLTER